MPHSQICVWILPDQLVLDHPAIQAAEQDAGRDKVRITLVESQAWLTRLPYHKKRAALYLSAGRHYAEELRERGYAVEVLKADSSVKGLKTAIKRYKAASVRTMAASEYGIREWQQNRASTDLGVPVTVVPNSMFLVESREFAPQLKPGRKLIMENFYRGMRKNLGLLIEPDGEPTGGEWNFDSENRKPLPATVRLPSSIGFEPDAITQQVLQEVAASGQGIGTLDGFNLAVTRVQAEIAFQDFLKHRLAQFGPYEDAMSHRSGTLFHSMLSPQMNLGLINPLAMCRAAEAEHRAGRAPINSVEGFIRQIIGWREFIYWQYHRQMPGLRTTNAWNCQRPMPAFFWDGNTEMRCLKTVISRLLETGFSHHIERLMLVCNFCLLAGVDPGAVADWFLACYVDSHDWVVLPNVMGMGLNADGGITATKPYIASAAYIRKMSDYCKGCRYQPDQKTGPNACPFNLLYWNFLVEHEARLRSNPRLGPNVLGLRHLSAEDRSLVQVQAHEFLSNLEPYAGHPEAKPGPRFDL